MIRSTTEAEDPEIAQKRAALSDFAAQALASYLAGDPRIDHLINLIHLNFVNSLSTNASILGLHVEWLNCNSVSPIGLFGRDKNASEPPALGPRSLVPTALQLRMPHHPWIDLFPFSEMRDNFLVATSSYLSEEAEIQLWNDIVESGSPGGDWTGLIVWGDPWNPDSWEVSMRFMRQWGWLLDGCPQIIDSTNRWRRKRGEGCISRNGAGWHL